jgi:SAM-dependent methyltransferase
MHTNSNRLFEKYAVSCFQPGMRVLEIGPDLFPSTYRKLLQLADITWDTLDIYADPQLTYPKSDVYSFAIPDNTYDIVFSGNVIEHVAKVWRWVPELARITKPGGLVITINPTSWPYHPAPIDCWRIYPDGMQALCDEAGLKVELSFLDRSSCPIPIVPCRDVPRNGNPPGCAALFASWAGSDSRWKRRLIPSRSPANRPELPARHQPWACLYPLHVHYHEVMARPARHRCICIHLDRG